MGKKDYYKIMKYNQYTEIKGYNMYGTLNRPSGKIKPRHRVSQLKSPSRILNIEMIRKNKLEIYLDGGWTLGVRIHNARSEIEPSLKLDIRTIGIPNNMYVDRERWISE